MAAADNPQDAWADRLSAMLAAYKAELDAEYAERFRALTHEEQLEMAVDPRAEVRQQLALNVTISRETMEFLLTDPEVWLFLQSNPNFSEDLIVQLFTHPDIDTRWYDPETFFGTVPLSQETEAMIQSVRDNAADHKHGLTHDYDPASGFSWVLESLWSTTPGQHTPYEDLIPDTPKLHDEYLVEHWTLKLLFTPTFVLARITEKLAPLIKNRKRSPYTRSEFLEIDGGKGLPDDELHIATVLTQVASHPNADAKILKTLVETGNTTICQNAALSAKLSLPHLRKLMEMPGLPVFIARHPHENIQALFLDLVESEDPAVLNAMAGNEYLKSNQLHRLQNDAPERRLIALAGNPRTFPRTLEELSEHPSPQVRMAVAGNPAVRPTILERLLTDEEPSVALTVATNTAAQSHQLEAALRLSPLAKPLLARNPATPKQLLQALTEDSAIDEYLATNPRLSFDLQNLLVKRGQPRAMQLLAMNPVTDATVFHRLSTTADPITQLACVNHDHIDNGSLLYLREHGVTETIRTAAVRKLILRGEKLKPLFRLDGLLSTSKPKKQLETP